MRPDALFKTMAYGSTDDRGGPPTDPFGAQPPGAPPRTQARTKDTFDFGTGLDLAPEGPPPNAADPFRAAGPDPFGPPTRDRFGASPPRDPFAAPPAPPRDPFGAPPPRDPFGAPPPTRDAFTSPSPTRDAFTSPSPTRDAFTSPSPTRDAFTSPPPTRDVFASPPPTRDVFNAPPRDPFGAPPPRDPFGAPPPRDPFGAAPPHDPFGAPPPGADPFAASADPFAAPIDPFAAPPRGDAPPRDPFGAPPAADPFAANPFGGRAPDPFAAPTAPPSRAPTSFGPPTYGGGEARGPFAGSGGADPFGAPPADPFGAPPVDPFAAPTSRDPFGAPPADPFAAPTARDPFAPPPGSAYAAPPPPRSAVQAPPPMDPRQASAFHVQAAAGQAARTDASGAPAPGEESLFELDVPDAPLSERAPGQRGQRQPQQRRRQRAKKKASGNTRALALALFGVLTVGLSLGLTEYGFFGVDALSAKGSARTFTAPPPPVHRAKKKTATVLLTDSGGDYTQRILELQAVLHKDPKNQETMVELALTLARFHERHPAMFRADPAFADAFKKATTPEMLAGHKALDTWDLLAQGRIDDAAARVAELVDEQRSPGQDLYLAGRVAQKKGEAARARQLYDLALERLPDFEPALFEIGRLQLEGGDVEGAKKTLHKLKAKNGKHMGAVLTLADIALEEKDFAATETLVNQALPVAAEARDRDAQFRAFRLGARVSELQNKVEDRIYSLERALEIRPRDEQTALELSRLLADAGKSQDALDRLQVCHKAGCNSAEFYLALVQRYVDAGHKENAKNHLAEALDKHPKDTGLLMQQADFDKQVEQWNTAKTTYGIILAADPGFGPAYLELAAIQSREGQEVEALVTLRAALDKARDKQALMERVAELQVAMGATLQAGETMRQLLELEPDNFGVKLRFALLLKQLDQTEEALKYFRELADVGKLDADARTQYAEVLLRAGRHDDALAELTKVLEGDPLSLQANILRGMIHTARKDFAQADDDFRKALRVNPESARAYHQLGLNELAQRKIPAATEFLAKAADLSPNDLDIRFDLARVLSAVGGADNRKKAIAQYTSILRVYAGYTTPLEKRLMRPEVYFNRGQLHYEMGKFNQALEDFRAALALAPGREELMVEFAKTLTTMNRPGEAKAYLSEVLKRQKDHPGASFQLAKLSLQEGRSGEAESYFKQALVTGGSAEYAAAHRYLGFIYKERGAKAAMCQEFREYLRNTPTTDYDRTDVVQLVRGCR